MIFGTVYDEKAFNLIQKKLDHEGISIYQNSSVYVGCSLEIRSDVE